MVERTKQQKMKVRLPPLPKSGRMRRQSKEWKLIHRLLALQTRAPDEWIYVCSLERPFGWTHEFMLGPVERGRRRVGLRVEASPGWSAEEPF